MNVQLIGWAIVHSIWQGAAIALVAALLFRLTSRESPALRYWIGLTGLGLMIALPVATVMRGNLGVAGIGSSTQVAFESAPAQLASPSLPAADPAAFDIVDAELQAQSGISRMPATIGVIADATMPWIVAAWFIGLLIASGRLIGGISRTRGLTRVGVANGSEMLEAAIARLVAKLGIDRVVHVLESSRTSVPLVVGALRPVIVIPASLVTGLTPLQLDMLLAHELAHVRHHDFLVNLIQTVIETLMFYHPAVRWLSNRVRDEREHRCDDVAVQVSGGDAHAYTETLLALEETRASELGLAAAASGGSLLRRARRLLLGEPAHIDIGPRWIAGFVAIAAALLVARDAVGLGVQASFSPVTAFEAVSLDDTLEKKRRKNLPDPSRAAPASVLRSPAAGTLADRWKWAEQSGRTLGTSYWVGYLVAGDPERKSRFYLDDMPVYFSEGMFSGHLLFSDADLSGLTFSGVPLKGVAGDHLPSSTAIFFLLSNGLAGKRVDRIHVGSFSIPTYFDRKPLVWLDSASDAESIALVKSISARARSKDQKRDMVAVIGSHYSAEVVPYLAEILESRSEQNEVREEAAEWLGKRGNDAAIPPLSRAARTDPSSDIREEAIEAFGHMKSPVATDSLIVFASSLEGLDHRKTAIEALGHRKDSRAFEYLKSVATSATNSSLSEDAVEALAEMPDGMGFEAVVEIARTSRSVESRKRAVDEIASHKNGRPLEILSEIVRSDPDEDVRREAVDAIAEVHDARSVAILRDLANTNSSESIQMAAAEALGETVDNAAALIALRSIVANHRSYDVRTQAMESMIEMKGGKALVSSIARSTTDAALRERAREILKDNE